MRNQQYACAHGGAQMTGERERASNGGEIDSGGVVFSALFPNETQTPEARLEIKACVARVVVCCTYIPISAFKKMELERFLFYDPQRHVASKIANPNNRSALIR